MLPKSTTAIIIYKLSAELLLLVLLGSIVFLMAEIILPGFVSSRINFSYAYLAILTCLILLILSHRFLPQSEVIVSSSRRSPTWLMGLGILSLTLLFVNDLHGLSLFQSVSILFTLGIFLFSFLPIVLKRS